MVTRYVWWDEVQKLKRRRRDLHLPEPLDDFAREVAKRHGVSVNSLLVGIIAHAFENNEAGRLQVTVVPAVRITGRNPAGTPVEITAPAASRSYRKRSGWPEVR